MPIDLPDYGIYNTYHSPFEGAGLSPLRQSPLYQSAVNDLAKSAIMRKAENAGTSGLLGDAVSSLLGKIAPEGAIVGEGGTGATVAPFALPLLPLVFGYLHQSSQGKGQEYLDSFKNAFKGLDLGHSISRIFGGKGD